MTRTTWIRVGLLLFLLLAPFTSPVQGAEPQGSPADLSPARGPGMDPWGITGSRGPGMDPWGSPVACDRGPGMDPWGTPAF